MDVGKEKLRELLAKLREERDQLRVKVHLGAMEAKDEWVEREKKWQRLESRLGQAKDGAVESSQGVGENVGVVAEELKAAYQRIRERLGKG